MAENLKAPSLLNLARIPLIGRAVGMVKQFKWHLLAATVLVGAVAVLVVTTKKAPPPQPKQAAVPELGELVAHPKTAETQSSLLLKQSHLSHPSAEGLRKYGSPGSNNLLDTENEPRGAWFTGTIEPLP